MKESNPLSLGGSQVPNQLANNACTSRAYCLSGRHTAQLLLTFKQYSNEL
jgi:hypothetical protein